MALQTVFDCGFMNDPLAPILGNFIMTTEADHGLAFFQYMIVGGTMGCMTSGTVFIDSRFMGNFGVLDNPVYVVVAFKAELARFFLHDKGKVSGMCGMAAITLPFGHWGMGPYAVASLLN